MSTASVLNFSLFRRRSVPVFLQAEAAECGLACLAMVARYHGHDVDLAGLRRRFSTSLKGTTLSRLIDIATELDLVPRPLRLDLEQLGELNTPCILHWDLSHFVVLKRVTKNHIEIHDPAAGVRSMSIAEASKHFTGVAVELRPSASFKPVHARRPLSFRRLIGQVSGLGRAVGIVLGLALTIEAFTLIGPFFIQWVMDQVLVSGDRDLLTVLAIAFLAVTVLRVLFTAVRGRTIAWVSSSLSAQWASNLFRHMLRLPLDWFGKRHVGDVVSRFGSMTSIQDTLSTSFTTSLLDGLMTVATLILMYFYSGKLALFVTCVIALYSVIRVASFRILRQVQEEQLSCAARQQSEMMESVRGIQTIKLANKQSVRLTRYANATVEMVNRTFSLQQLQIIFDALNQLIFGVARIIVIWWGAKLVLDGQFTIGMLVAFLAYADQCAARGASVVDKLMELRMLGLHAERIADIALTDPEEHEGPAGLTDLSPEASIELRNVGFKYSEEDPWVFRHVNLHVRVGESVALVGASGCGKSTLAKLILGLLEPNEGEILVGGVDIRRLGMEAYRNLLGAVMQDDPLFAGSISDNIAFFDPDINLNKVEGVAQFAALHDDIVAMPMGYNTLVGDMGSTLSGGQKQRVCLARALYRMPKILILDEATSHLDVHCERTVSTSIARSKVTRIVIAHRPETIALADRVVQFVSSGEGATLVDEPMRECA